MTSAITGASRDGGRGPRHRQAAQVRDRGASDALALVLLAPAAIAMALVIIFLGRQVDARAQVHAAAEAGAQAAALARDPASADAAARRVVSATLVDSSTCANPDVAVDLSGFGPGGVVTVWVSCTARPQGIEPTGASPVTFDVRAAATIDEFRAMTP